MDPNHIEMDLNNLDLEAAGLNIVAEEDRHTPMLAALAMIIDLAKAAILETRAEKAQLKKSGDLSETGLDRKLEEFGRGQLNRLDAFGGNHIERARDHVAVLEKRLAQIPEEAKGDAATAKAVEIREHLAKLPDIERMSVMEEALASGETEVVAALFDAPIFLQRSLIAADDFRSDLRRRHLEQTQPAIFTELTDLKFATRQAENALQVARSKIAEVSGSVADDLPAMLASVSA